MSNQPYSEDPRVQNYQQPPIQGYDANDVVRSESGNGAYVQSQRETYVDPAGNRVESHEQVFEDKNLQRANLRYWITSVTYFILAVLEILLALRFIFRLLGAHTDNGFIAFLYNLTGAFVGAFNGIFNDQGAGNNVFEVSTLVAIVVYALVAWGIVSLARVILAPQVTGRQRLSTTRRNRIS